MHHRANFYLTVALAICGTAISALAQGPLAPAAAPAPSMRTLQQIEPRIPLDTLPVVITEPGNYYLTQDWDFSSAGIQTAITIEASDVRIDLGGFALKFGGTSAIQVASGMVNTQILNGSITNWGSDGIQAQNAASLSVTGVVIANFGNFGIQGGANSRIENCTIYNGLSGIISRENSHIRNCQLYNLNSENGTVIVCSAGAGSIVSDCTVRNSSWAFLANNSLMRNLVVENCQMGVAGEGCTMENVAVSNSGAWGVLAVDGVISNCRVSHAGGSAYLLRDTKVGDSLAIRSQVGFDVLDSQLRDCQAQDNVAQGFKIQGQATEAAPGEEDVTLQTGALLTNCTATGNGGTGFSLENARATNSVARRNGVHGFTATSSFLSGCMALDNTQNGFSLDRSKAQELSAVRNGQAGITCGDHGELVNSASRENGNSGITTGNGGVVRGNAAEGNGTADNGVAYAQIFVEGDRNRIDGNHCMGEAGNNDFGIQVRGSSTELPTAAKANVIIANTVGGHLTRNYDVPALNLLGTVLSTSNAAAGSSSAAHANFEL